MANLRTDYEDGELILADFFNETNQRVNTISPQVENLKEQSDGLQDTLDEFMGEHGSVPSGTSASQVTVNSSAGLNASNVQQALGELATEVFPLTVAIASSNAGTYEVGDAQHSVTPQIVLSITRKGADVSSSAQTTSSQGEVQSDHKTIIGSALTNGTTTFQITVSQGGQTKSAPNQVFDFMNYRYYGVINSSTEPTKAQVKTLCENGTLTKQLSRSTKMGATDLAANKCFVFVVPNTSVNLIVKNAKSGNPISGCTVDTVTINRVNGTDIVSCKYVIVPSGAAAWTFEITN